MIEKGFDGIFEICTLNMHRIRDCFKTVSRLKNQSLGVFSHDVFITV